MRKSYFYVGLAILIFTCIAIGVGYEYRSSRISSDISSSTSSSEGWKTYRNDAYGFEFKYPSGLALFAHGDRVVIEDNSKFDPRHSLPYLFLETTVGDPSSFVADDYDLKTECQSQTSTTTQVASGQDINVRVGGHCNITKLQDDVTLVMALIPLKSGKALDFRSYIDLGDALSVLRTLSY